MTGSGDSGQRFYDDLAVWWPLLSPPADYAEEAEFIATLLAGAQRPVREVLELGSGGGHLASHLTDRYDLTLTDVSEPMLAVSRALNPGSRHEVGDMRTLRLRRSFDAVIVHDAIDYMTTEADLGRVVETAFVHCRAGGVVVLAPDHTAETFDGGTEVSGSDAPDGSGVRLFEWTWDPDPGDTKVRTEYVFVTRTAAGTVDVHAETHETGLFPEAAWLRTMTDAGFVARAVPEQTSDERDPRTLFVGHRARDA